MIEASTQRLIIKWLVGSILGTFLVGVTSPLFVRSYLPRPIDPIRGVRTMSDGSTFRWRSEGYASTQIGLLGMPGKTMLRDPSSDSIRVALWGDSQAEGVCVADDKKLFAQIERLSSGSVDVFPLARSGDDASDWLKQFLPIQRKLSIDVHVVLVVDLPDLLVKKSKQSQSNDFALVNSLPAFLIHASRNLITDQDSGAIRKLRFAVGPVATSFVATSPSGATSIDWRSSIGRLRDATDKPILILYSPPLPQIVGGQARFHDAAAGEFSEMRSVATSLGIRVVNTLDAQCESAKANRWPHGFHNGKIGDGHLNAIGYEVIAEVLVDAIESEK